jgi:hypothetical protein
VHSSLKLHSLRTRWRQFEIPLSAIQRSPRPNAFGSPEHLALIGRQRTVARRSNAGKPPRKRGAWNCSRHFGWPNRGSRRKTAFDASLPYAHRLLLPIPSVRLAAFDRWSGAGAPLRQPFQPRRCS